MAVQEITPELSEEKPVGRPVITQERVGVPLANRVVEPGVPLITTGRNAVRMRGVPSSTTGIKVPQVAAGTVSAFSTGNQFPTPFRYVGTEVELDETTTDTEVVSVALVAGSE